MACRASRTLWPARCGPSVLGVPPNFAGLLVLAPRLEIPAERVGGAGAEDDRPSAGALARASTYWLARSTSSTLRPSTSPARAPVSMNNLISAKSRRSSKVEPLHAAMSRTSCSSVRISTGCSGTVGADMHSVGERVISLSSTIAVGPFQRSREHRRHQVSTDIGVPEDLARFQLLPSLNSHSCLFCQPQSRSGLGHGAPGSVAWRRCDLEERHDAW